MGAAGSARTKTSPEVLLPFLGTVMRRTQKGFEALAEAVKARAEAP
ncbi:MAG: hypothetical protein FJ000_02430 [Actinobacteria bacterium]|nr:hypothetical protein [Actinomycetota bacterium]